MSRFDVIIIIIKGGNHARSYKDDFQEGPRTKEKIKNKIRMNQENKTKAEK